MTIDTKCAPTRRAVRASAVTLGLLLGSLAVPAFAAPPDTWEKADNGSALNDLLFIVGVPVAVFLLLTLLVFLPSMMRRQSSEPALAFRERATWFGGPRKGVEATTSTAGATSGTGEEQSGKGGASARW